MSNRLRLAEGAPPTRQPIKVNAHLDCRRACSISTHPYRPYRRGCESVHRDEGEVFRLAAVSTPSYQRLVTELAAEA